jgi:hypothetical protein
LTEIKTESPADVKTGPMGHLVFKCPRTGMNVQHWLADEPAPDDRHSSYESVACQACGGLHFVNRSSGKLLGEHKPESAPLRDPD